MKKNSNEDPYIRYNDLILLCNLGLFIGFENLPFKKVSKTNLQLNAACLDNKTYFPPRFCIYDISCIMILIYFFIFLTYWQV